MNYKNKTGVAAAEAEVVEQYEDEGIREEENTGWTDEEEREGRRIKTKSGFKMFMSKVDKYKKRLGDEEERELARKAQAGDEEAREKLVNHNLKLVVSVATQYTGRGIDLWELITFGNNGLSRAVNKFDTQQESARFGTYAYNWIRVEIDRGVAETLNIISKPDYVMRRINAVSKVQTTLKEVMRREPTEEEISAAMNGKLSSKEIKEVKTLMNNRTVLSLDKTVDDEATKGRSIGDVFSVDEGEDPAEYAARLEREEAVQEAINRLLEPRDRQIVRMAFGVGKTAGSETKVYTFTQIAEQLAKDGYTNKKGELYSKEYVRQRLEKAKMTLREDKKLREVVGA